MQKDTKMTNKTVNYLNTLLGTHLTSQDNPLKALEILTDTYGIKVSNFEDSLFVLNYDQINSKQKTNAIVKECRSLVVGLTFVGDRNIPEFELVSRSMDRFFNHGEVPFPHKIDKLEAHEKMDGSLVTLWFDDWCTGDWAYRTRSMIMPELEINNWSRTWKDLIEFSLGTKYPEYLNEEFSYILEVTGQENRVVVRYPDNKLATLLAVRNNVTGTYLPASIVGTIANIVGWDRPRCYKFKTIEEVEKAALALPNLEEGYVMYKDGTPIGKCKNPAYVAAHHLRGEGLNPKRCLQLVCMGELEEYISVFPEDTDMLEPYRTLLDSTIGTIESEYKRMKHLESQKHFAAIATQHLFSSCLFQMRSKGITAHTAFFNLTEKAQHRLLEQYL